MRRVGDIPEFCKACSKSTTLKFINSSNESTTSGCEHSKVAILFSGGLDSAVLAALVDQCLPQNESIDLLNIAFEKQQNKSKIKGNKKRKKKEF
jgi:tRNA(Ile)-lysidine synthase TilS/MesJ